MEKEEKYSEMSNAELKREKIMLQDKFDSVKRQIDGLYDTLKELNAEYSKVKREMENRTNIFN